MKTARSVILFITAALTNMSARALTIETVPVGNPNNPADTRYSAIGYGSVGYDYRIGKYEVTTAQYAEFLNAVDPAGHNARGLYNSEMQTNGAGSILTLNTSAPNGFKYSPQPGRENIPINWISWFDALRFTNWLQNGRGAGDTENGAYTLLGGTEIPSNANTITRNPGARWFLPSEDEWYKAAYHKNNGVTGDYWNYPTSTDAVPYSDQPPGSDAPDPSNTANAFKNDGIANGYDDGYALSGSNSYSYWSNVGSYPLSSSPYGTFDQGGNLWEYNETHNGSGSTWMRGGSWGDSMLHLAASDRNMTGFMNQGGSIGFRVATIAVPEPGILAVAVLAIATIAWRRRVL